MCKWLCSFFERSKFCCYVMLVFILDYEVPISVDESAARMDGLLLFISSVNRCLCIAWRREKGENELVRVLSVFFSIEKHYILLPLDRVFPETRMNNETRSWTSVTMIHLINEGTRWMIILSIIKNVVEAYKLEKTTAKLFPVRITCYPITNERRENSAKCPS